jgi:hypothetical protein
VTDRIYPSDTEPYPEFRGFAPVDFVLESIIEQGIEWFRTDPSAPDEVFGQFLRPGLERYGRPKIEEITKYIIDHEIRVIQSFPLAEDSVFPSISINLADGNQAGDLQGLGLYDGEQTLGDEGGEVETKGYLPMQDDMMIGIHAVGGADKVKYLYYLVVYIIASSIKDLEEMGFMQVQIRATDLARVNELLPANVFSRFVNVSMRSAARFREEIAPVISSIGLNVNYE